MPHRLPPSGTPATEQTSPDTAATERTQAAHEGPALSRAAIRRAARCPIHKLTGVQVAATGSYVPEREVTNAELQLTHGFDPDWVVQRTGIEKRRVAPPEMATSDLAVLAARRCLANANVNAEDVDLVLVATFTSDEPVPSTACRVQHQLGIRAPAMDIQAACAGFMYAMVTGMQFVSTGCAQRALVIGAETITRVVDPTDQRTYPLFGDAAGAVLLEPGSNAPGKEQGLVAYTLGADGSGAELIRQEMGGSRLPTCAAGLAEGKQYLRMDGRPVFKWAVRLVSDTVLDVTEAAGVSIRDITSFIAHQANMRIIDAAVKELNVDRRRVFTNLQNYGNTSAGSIPLALDEAHAEQRFDRGDLLLLCGFGAGLTWGTALLRW